MKMNIRMIADTFFCNTLSLYSVKTKKGIEKLWRHSLNKRLNARCVEGDEVS